MTSTVGQITLITKDTMAEVAITVTFLAWLEAKTIKQVAKIEATYCKWDTSTTPITKTVAGVWGTTGVVSNSIENFFKGIYVMEGLMN